MNKKEIMIDIIRDKLIKAEKKYYKYKKCTGCGYTKTELYPIVIRNETYYVCPFCKKALTETLHADKLTLHKLSIRQMINQLNPQDSSSSVKNDYEDFGYYNVAKYNQDHEDC